MKSCDKLEKAEFAVLCLLKFCASTFILSAHIHTSTNKSNYCAIVYVCVYGKFAQHLNCKLKVVVLLKIGM